MKRQLKTTGFAWLAFFLVCTNQGLFAQDEPKKESEILLPAELTNYDTSSLGYSLDKYENRFMDIYLSLKYPIARNVWETKNFTFSVAPYLAFVSRLAFHVGSRPSSPVIGKTFNPKVILFRWFPEGYYGNKKDAETYVDLAYAHESNGQDVTDLNQYKNKVDSLGSAVLANDFIDRGWDSVEIRGKYEKRLSESFAFSGLIQINYYLPNSLLQGAPDEYRDWENDPEGKKRSQVDGFKAGMSVKYFFPANNFFLKGIQLGGYYTTGLLAPFKYHSLRTEFVFTIGHLPLLFYYQTGYVNDLSMYYKQSWLAGFALQYRGW